ncbi:MAG: 1-acyl-sn-glycerol-3-phosphate acyltransferase [Rubrivivax sp.]|nr:1-acyl-sn-glycerol-3-phosphate acyltransferase [Pyrinomonadaceae bacterium]
MRVLRLVDMLLRRKGALAQRLAHAVISIALRLFFRRIETSRAHLVPASGALVFVLNHPNGMIDPGLVFAAMPRRISFLAKSTLFRLPLIGWLLRTVEALPLHRRVDDGADITQNLRTFEACRHLLRRGRCIALFPEGVSHNATKLLPIKTGAARIALGALSINEAGASPSGRASFPHLNALPDGLAPASNGVADTLELKIIPVGLYYTSKTSFRSEALLRFGPPLEVRAVELDEQGEPPRDAVLELSARIEEALRGVTLNVETEEELDVARKAERLFSSVYEGLNMRVPLAERFMFLRRLSAEVFARLSAAEGVELRRRLLRHEEELRRIGIAPENLQLSRHSAWHVFRHFLLRAGVLLLLLPLTVAGALVHLPAYLACTLLARVYPTHGVDEIAPTVKILAAILLMPLTWLTVSALAFIWFDWRAALAALPLSILCGYVAMRSLEEIYDMRGWFKAVLLIVRRRKLFLRLLIERRALQDEISSMDAHTGG